MLKKWQLDLAWKIDWFLNLLGKRRQLTKSTAKSAYTKTVYEAEKLKTPFPEFEYTPIETTLSRVAKHFNCSRELK